MQSLLSSFIDDELEPRDTETLLLHLRSCRACREELEELRTLQQLHKRAVAQKSVPISSLAFTKRVIAAVREQNVDGSTVESIADALSAWPSEAFRRTLAWRRAWIAASLAAAAAAVVVALSPLSSPERGLRPVSELKASSVEVAAVPRDAIEHYLAEHSISVAETRLAGSATSVEFVSYTK